MPTREERYDAQKREKVVHKISHLEFNDGSIPPAFQGIFGDGLKLTVDDTFCVRRTSRDSKRCVSARVSA